MKSVILSIKPKYCELIASGKKTIEVRKTRPNIDTPFMCYIYCTKEKYIGRFLHTSDKNGCLLFWLNENDCTIFRYPENTSYTAYTCNGKVIGEFVCDEILIFGFTPYNHGEYMVSGDIKNKRDILRESCLSFNEMYEYIGEKYGYGWHISDLVIYDEPKELSKFYTWCPEYEREYITSKCTKCRHYLINEFDGCFECACEGEKLLTRPPQSWCYVEEVD